MAYLNHICLTFPQDKCDNRFVSHLGHLMGGQIWHQICLRFVFKANIIKFNFSSSVYFATDLTPLHVKISRSTNLWSPCRRKLKLSTYLNTLSYNHISSPRSCQDIEEYGFVESLSEETQIIDLFKHFKLQPHKLSKYTLANCLSSCQFRILLSIR